MQRLFDHGIHIQISIRAQSPGKGNTRKFYRRTPIFPKQFAIGGQAFGILGTPKHR